MFIVCKKNYLFIAGEKKETIKKDYVGPVSEWITKTPLFKNAVNAGNIIVSSKKDKDIDEALKKEPAKSEAEKRADKEDEQKSKDTKDTKKSK